MLLFATEKALFENLLISNTLREIFELIYKVEIITWHPLSKNRYLSLKKLLKKHTKSLRKNIQRADERKKRHVILFHCAKLGTFLIFRRLNDFELQDQFSEVKSTFKNAFDFTGLSRPHADS